MLSDRLELALHGLTADRHTRRAYLEAPAETLAKIGLDDAAAAMVRDLDVRSLLEAGVSPLLTWGLWLLYGSGGADGYLAALGRPGERGPSAPLDRGRSGTR